MCRKPLLRPRGALPCIDALGYPCRRQSRPQVPAPGSKGRKRLSLHKIRTFLFKRLLRVTEFKYRRIYGMDLGQDVRISRGARLDRTNPRGVHIGDYTAITGGAAILTHDFVNRVWKDTYIGKNCFLGFNAIVLAGVRVGDGCIISANTVVVRDVPANSVVMGNPGKVVEQNIVTSKWGIRLDKGNASPIKH